MKIGFDVSQTGVIKAGCGFYAESLICNLAVIDSVNNYFLYSTFGNHYWDDQFQSTCRFNLPNFYNGLEHSSLAEAKNFWQEDPSEIETKLGDVDILHANNFFCPPKFEHTRLVYTLYDLSFLEHPECSTEENRLACFEGVFNASLRADMIIAISHYTREHFLKTFPYYPAERVVVAYPASRFNNIIQNVEISKKLKKLRPQQFWLNVGTIEPRKNIVRLLHAYAKLKKQQPETTYPLVLAGQAGWLENDIDELLNELDLSEYVHVLGYVGNDDLQWLYQNSFCLVYPSLFEGFGMPVLEAMCFGTPIITSNVSSLPEVVGDAAILIDPLDENALQQAMFDLAHRPDIREDLKKLAFKQSKLFSWEHTARKVLGFYEKALSLSPWHGVPDQKKSIKTINYETVS